MRNLNSHLSVESFLHQIGKSYHHFFVWFHQLHHHHRSFQPKKERHLDIFDKCLLHLDVCAGLCHFLNIHEHKYRKMYWDNLLVAKDRYWSDDLYYLNTKRDKAIYVFFSMRFTSPIESIYRKCRDYSKEMGLVLNRILINTYWIDIHSYSNMNKSERSVASRFILALVEAHQDYFGSIDFGKDNRHQ